MTKPKRKRPTASKRPATSADVNAFIKKHAASCANWQALADRVAAELGVDMPWTVVRQRGSRLGVAAQGRRTSGVFAQPKPSELPGDPLEAKLAAILKKRKQIQTVEQLANQLDVPPYRIGKAMEALKASGHNVVSIGDKVELSLDVPKAEPFRIDARKLEGKVFRFGLTADNHLCFPPSTPVETKDGPVRICNVRVGDLVLTHRGRYRPVKEVIANPHDGTYVRVSFKGPSRGGSNAYASTLCTPNHPLLVVRENREGFLPAGELRPGDAVRGLGKPCSRCSKATGPLWVKVCHDCDPFVRPVSDEGKKRQRRAQTARSNGSEHWTRDILPETAKWQAGGWRVVPMERVRPDFIAIKGSKVVAVEVEAPARNRPRPMKEKYAWADHAKYYDDIVWLEKDGRTKKQNRTYSWLAPNAAGFIGFVVSKVERVKSRPQKVYNLVVAEDETYVAKRVVAHNCSKYERLEVLNALFDTWASQEIKTVYQLGNMIDGEARFNKFDLLAHGMEGQARYFAKHWPQRKGITTYYVTGDDHEGWYVQREGVEIGRYLQDCAERQGRKDLKYLGHMEHDIVLQGRRQNSTIRLIHAGGGSAYAVSYAPQKIVESYGPAEKPHVLLVGHYHKAEYLYWRSVHIVQGGTTMDQSPFMRKLKLAAHVGGWTIEMTVNEDGVITRFKSEWLPFFDREFYVKPWRYGDLARPAVAA